MKPFIRILPFLLALAACSPKSETHIGFVKSFSFDVPTDTQPDSLTRAIERAFLLRYNLMDTSMVAGGKVIPANILAYDSASNQTKCVQGYAILVNENPKYTQVPDYDGQYFGSPRKVYFFTGSNNHYEVWNNPIVTTGAREDADEDVNITLEYAANGECAFLGLSINSPVQVVGLMQSETMTFYYWSEQHHRLDAAANFLIAYSKMGDEPAGRQGKLAVIPSGNPYGIQYTLSGDENSISRYTWVEGEGRYVVTSVNEDQSGYVLVLDSMKDVMYPLFKSTKNPKAAESINKALQMQDFGELVTSESYDRLLKGDDPVSNPDAWEFYVKRINSNVLLVSTVRLRNVRPMPEPDYHRYYFNAYTGDPIGPIDLIAQIHQPDFGRKVTAILKAAIDGQQKAPCFDYTMNVWSPEQVFTSWDHEHGILTFRTPLCDNRVEGLYPAESGTWYNMMEATAPMSDFDSLRTEYFDNMMSDEEVLDPPDNFSRVWHGLIDGKVAVTVMLWQQPESSNYGGHLIYDAKGKSIPFRSALADGAQSITIEELDDDYKNVMGTFNLTFNGTKLAGTYKSPDGKDKPFTAVTARWGK